MAYPAYVLLVTFASLLTLGGWLLTGWAWWGIISALLQGTTIVRSAVAIYDD